jgi:uncharacterized protein YdaU (DUF1376 family)
MMHYYKFNIADYRKDTSHLSTLEHGVYRQLIDWQYLDEKPIPLETQVVSRRLRLATQDEQKALENILSEFFERSEDGYFQKRIRVEILDYQENAEKNRRNGKLGGRPSKTQSVSSGLDLETQTKGNQEPITNNHKPIVKATKGSRLSTDFELPDSWTEFCQSERPDLNPRKVFDSFKDYWVAKAGASGVKLDWTATWRNWVRNQNIAKPLFNKADIAHVTVPSSSNRDPALVKLDEDRKRVVPPNPEVLAKIRAVLGKQA